MDKENNLTKFYATVEGFKKDVEQLSAISNLTDLSELEKKLRMEMMLIIDQANWLSHDVHLLTNQKRNELRQVSLSNTVQKVKEVLGVEEKEQEGSASNDKPKKTRKSKK